MDHGVALDYDRPVTNEARLASALARERRRILAENARREAEIDPERYAAWNRAEQFFAHSRKRLAAELLHAVGRFPDAGSRCLEIGFGRGSWLADLLAWGASERHLFGVEIDLERTASARRRLAAAHLVNADAGELPWPDASFDLVVVSTVLTSILDPEVRQLIASEIERVLAAGGVLVWYDFAVRNPRNPSVRPIRRHELRDLFPRLRGEIRSATLAPPLVRLTAPWSWWLTELLQSLPFLRTHLLAVLIK